jgi:hypothetical protein
MSRKSTLGLAVLALVALHSSSFIELAASGPSKPSEDIGRLFDRNIHLDASKVLSILENEAERAGREQKIRDGYYSEMAPTLGDLIGLWQHNETQCTDESFKPARRLRAHAYDDSLQNYIEEATKRWEDYCFSHLDQQIRAGLGSLSELTRDYFKWFAGQDRAETLDYWMPNMAFGKLRTVVGSLEDTDDGQLEAAKGYLDACKEMIGQLDGIKSIRSNYQWMNIGKLEKYYPHIRFYDFCRLLVDFDFSKEVDRNFWGVDMNDFMKILENLAKMPAETAKSGHEQDERSLAVAAAAQFVKEVSNDHYRWGPGILDTPPKILDWLMERCSVFLNSVHNLLWAYEHDLLGLEHGGNLSPSTEKNLRCLKACKQLEELPKKKILDSVGEFRAPHYPMRWLSESFSP